MKSEGLTPAQLAERNAELPRITQEKPSTYSND